ncbi:FAD-dependent oxidoreductase [Sphingopyxis sp. BSNA05]|uniref:FAD-dependent oxidoreductase n=1 Tax=Sphingopyxis sp. BSNA05 TaxID=1236614 RepID=UPI00349F24C6
MYDLAIIGGGINGVGIARDAAGRGLKVLLVERDDLASHTSSASTKLVHGGLRYLEHYEFNLVRKALKEREVLLRAAPHIIWPMRFVLPVDEGMRPAWLLRLGLFLYDHLGGRDILPGTRSLDLLRDRRGDPLQKRLKKGFAYSDCWVEAPGSFRSPPAMPRTGAPKSGPGRNASRLIGEPITGTCRYENKE